MSRITDKILEESIAYIRELYQSTPPELVYHTLDHVEYVAEAVDEIGKATGLPPEELNLAKFCAWFHDVGYIKSFDDHETVGAGIAREFLESKGVEEAVINHVEKCILATRVPQSPEDMVCGVLCDADMKHLAVPDYYEYVERMRQEEKNIKHVKISKQQFDIRSIKFFKNHSYYTEYGKTVLQQGKEKNKVMIEEKINKRGNKKDEEVKTLNKEIGKLQKKLEKSKGYSRGVESMFRLTARNQINLSSIADNKSNILISVNTIIISIVLSLLVSRFAELPQIILPTLVFLLFSLITIIFAILSTRPNISGGTFTRDDIKEKKVNLLFFGNFYNMGLDDYSWALEEMMKNDEYLYSTMIKDQYFLGKVLARKYKLLRWAYNFFMVGLIVSVLAYVLAFTNF